jgi:hypothetical protein
VDVRLSTATTLSFIIALLLRPVVDLADRKSDCCTAVTRASNSSFVDDDALLTSRMERRSVRNCHAELASSKKKKKKNARRQQRIVFVELLLLLLAAQHVRQLVFTHKLGQRQASVVLAARVVEVRMPDGEELVADATGSPRILRPALNNASSTKKSSLEVLSQLTAAIRDDLICYRVSSRAAGF